MPARFLNIVLVLFCVGLLAGCGLPFKNFVDGWPHDKQAERTEQQKCEGVKGQQWVNNSCQKEGTPLVNVSEDGCKDFPNATWQGNACVYFQDLKTADACASVGWKWSEERCMDPQEFDCNADATQIWVKTECLVRPTLSLAGPTTQVLAIGGVFQPLVMTLSPDAAPAIVNPTCSSFFQITSKTVTSVPAPAGVTVCEADIAVTTPNGATSQPVHVKATIDMGFLSYCNKFQDQDAARKERDLARTVFLLKAATQKATCDDAAKDLAGVSSLQMPDSAIVDLRPLSGLTALSVLDLSGNDIVDLTPIAYLTNLSVLNLSNNPLGTRVKITEKNCPTNKNVNFGVLDFCLGR